MNYEYLAQNFQRRKTQIYGTNLGRKLLLDKITEMVLQ